MEMFADNATVALQQATLPDSPTWKDIPALVEHAWHLRQRNTQKALKLCHIAQTLLSEGGNAGGEPGNDVGGLLARISLIQAEAKWLFAELELAAQMANDALIKFQTRADLIGCADAHWLLAMVAIDQGRHHDGDSLLEAVVRDARAANDSLRVDLAEAVLARWAVLRDPQTAVARWGQRFPDDCSKLPHALAAWVEDFHSLVGAQTSDFASSIPHAIAAHEAAMASGQIRHAIIDCTNIGEDFFRLNDHQSALEWMQKGLELARTTTWPRNVGACLMHTAEAMRHLGQLDAAQELLEQALTILAPLLNARSYAVALGYMGNLALDQGNYRLALDTFMRLEQRADELQQSDFQIDARRGQAHALSQLGQTRAALAAAHSALTIAREQQDGYRQIGVLQVLSTIHSRQPKGLSREAPAQGDSPALSYLKQAMALARTIEGYTLPGDLLDAVAREYACAGDYQKAYETALHAHSSREKTHSSEATNRSLALQVKYQTERARAESEHLRQLATLEAKRAEISLQTSVTLSHLSIIGQEITTHLNTEAVFNALNGHICSMLESSSFAVYLLEPDGSALFRAFCTEGNRTLPGRRIDINDPNAWSARCARERCELTADFQDQGQSNLVPGSQANLSALFAPLIIGDRLLGVMSVQAIGAHAYTEREWLIFRTLCAYGAIALDNASAYLQLQQAQAKLVAQEKMVALGSLVAGVAHELNTPIGNSLIIASTLHNKSDAFDQKMQAGLMRRSDLGSFIDDTRHGSDLIMRSLHNAVDLLSSFKQVAVDRTTAQRREFNLQQTCGEIVATMMNQIKHSGHSLIQNIPPDIILDSYPGPLGQVITNLINNALVHAFEGRSGGQMTLLAWQKNPTAVCIEFRDNGQGIAESNLGRIFDPFFTTKLGQGGSGLGLSISFNIITSLLGGSIKVQSTPTLGCTFLLELPLISPQTQQ